MKEKVESNGTTYVISKEINTKPLHIISKPIKDEWVVGYGMDDDKGHCRNYPTIYEI